MTTMTIKPSTMTSESVTLINYVEVWTLPENDDGSSAESLQLDHAFVVDRDQSRRIDSNQKNSPGQGIAGSAWKQQGPVILQGENSTVLANARSHAGIPIDALLAIPIFRDYDLVNVVVFGVTNGNGGIEIWTRDERDELAISGSWYEGLASFEFISQYVRFPKGAGVPGACWKDGRPRIVPRPAEAPGFIRSFDKDPAHLADCIGLPIGRDYGFAGSIILLLSDESKPFARNFSLWQCESSAPSESDPDPTIKFSGSSSNASDFSPAWCQQICDEVAKERGTVILHAESGNLPDGFQFGVVIPFFAKESINDLAVLLY
jgi:hypothetical protein